MTLTNSERRDALTQTFRAVVLKHRETGDVYAWTYKTTPRNEAIVRAYNALKRDHPDADTAQWTVTE